MVCHLFLAQKGGSGFLMMVYPTINPFSEVNRVLRASNPTGETLKNHGYPDCGYLAYDPTFMSKMRPYDTTARYHTVINGVLRMGFEPMILRSKI